MTTILLVCGSRTLGATTPMRSWVLDRISEALDGVSLVVAGDAYGPDTCAHVLAFTRALTAARWHVDGRVQYRLLLDWMDEARWDTDGTTADPRKRPLARNLAMVAWCADRLRAGDTVRCLALIDRASKSHGTEHTAAACERAGIVVVRRVWE